LERFETDQAEMAGYKIVKGRRFGNVLIVIGSMLPALFIVGALADLHDGGPVEALIVLSNPTVGVGCAVSGILLSWPNFITPKSSKA
jgi:uncharacterized YccA/Bax inhibitor family protein